MTTASAPEPEPSLRPVILQAIRFTVVVVGLVFLGGLFFREPLEYLSQWVVDELGLLGVFLGVVAADTLTLPVPPDTFIFVAVASQEAVVPLLIVVCAGSVLAGSLAYRLGPFIQRVPFLSKRIEEFRPRGEKLFQKYGVWTIVIAALTPIPFSVACWLAGIYKMPYRAFAAATLARIPRLVGYYWLFLWGWA